MPDKRVPLSRKYEAHGESFDAVMLREPKSRDHFEIGDPIEVHVGPDGEGRFVVEHLDRVKAYFERLPVSPGPECLLDLDLVDSISVKQAITDFFTEAHSHRNAPTNSSSEPAKALPKSPT